MYDTRRLSAALGIEIIGLDARTATGDAVDWIQGLWDDHLVVVLRRQELTAGQQRDFVSRFGMIKDLPTADPGKSDYERSVMIIGNQVVDGRMGNLPDGEMWFHHDQMYIEEPAAAGVLYGIILPSLGGNTLFANAAAAYDALPDDVKERLIGLRAQHVYDTRATTVGVDLDAPGVTAHEHPVVIRHPRTGRSSLFVSRLMTRRIVGVDAAEGAKLLGDLFDHVEDRRFVYEHEWSPGDLVMWDNTCVMHGRTDFDKSQPRILRRVSLARQSPLVPA